MNTIFVTAQENEALSGLNQDGLVTNEVDSDGLSGQEAGACLSTGAFIQDGVTLPIILTGNFSGITGSPIEDQSALSPSDRVLIGIGNLLRNGRLTFPLQIDAIEKTDNSQSND